MPWKMTGRSSLISENDKLRNEMLLQQTLSNLDIFERLGGDVISRNIEAENYAPLFLQKMVLLLHWGK